MTTLANRPNTALLVVDVQNGVVDGAHRRDEVVANIGSLVERARRERVPVVWVQHRSDELARGSDVWRIVPELTPDEAEPLVEKEYGNSFEDTTLESVLAGLGVGRLVVAGAETDACVRSTLHGAFARGYDATLVSDAHTAGDKTQWGAPPVDQVIAHTNLYWNYQEAPGGPPGGGHRGRRLRAAATTRLSTEGTSMRKLARLVLRHRRIVILAVGGGVHRRHRRGQHLRQPPLHQLLAPRAAGLRDRQPDPAHVRDRRRRRSVPAHHQGAGRSAASIPPRPTRRSPPSSRRCPPLG